MLVVEERGKFADPLTTVPQSRDDPHSGSEYPATDVWVPRRRDTYNVHYLDLPIMVTIWRGSGHYPITVTPHFFGRKMSYKMPSRIFLRKMPKDPRILLFALILFLHPGEPGAEYRNSLTGKRTTPFTGSWGYKAMHE